MISVNKSVQSVYSTFTKRGQGRTKADKPGVMNVTVPDPEEFIHSQTEADLFLVPRQLGERIHVKSVNVLGALSPVNHKGLSGQNSFS